MSNLIQVSSATGSVGTLAMADLVFVVKITDELKALKSICKPAVWILGFIKEEQFIKFIFMNLTVIDKCHQHS